MFFLSKNLHPKIQNLTLNPPCPILGKCIGKIKILSTHMIFFVGNLHLSVGKLQLITPPNFYNHDAAGQETGSSTGNMQIFQ